MREFIERHRELLYAIGWILVMAVLSLIDIQIFYIFAIICLGYTILEMLIKANERDKLKGEVR